MGERLGRINTWLSGRAWIWIAGMTIAIILLGVALAAAVTRITDNATKLSELQYTACLEDSIVDYKIAEGALIEAAFLRDNPQVTVLLPEYHKSLENLRGAQMSCGAKFRRPGG